MEVYMQVYMEAADEEGDENGRIDFPEFLAVMAKVIVSQMENYMHCNQIEDVDRCWIFWIIKSGQGAVRA